MAFSDDLSTDLANVFFNTVEWADSVTYTVAPDDSSGSASSSSIPAIPEANLLQVSNRSARGNVQFMYWHVSGADVTAPKRGDTITDSNSTPWRVIDVTRSVEYDGAFRLSCKAAQELN